MRDLIPFDVSALGLAEYAWLFLALGGLSLLAPPKRLRWRGAVYVSTLLIGFGWMYTIYDAPEGCGWPASC